VGAIAGCSSGRRSQLGRSYRFRPRMTLVVGCVIFLLAAISMVAFGNTPFYEGVEYMEAVSQFETIMKVPGFIAFFHYLIPGLFAVLIISRGFRWWYAPPLAFYFLMRMWSGWSRFSYLLGGALVVFAYMERRKLRWPTRTQSVLCGLFLLAFLAGKDWGRAWGQEGPQAAIQVGRSWLQAQAAGNGSDFNTYDMLVGVVHAVPEYSPHTGFLFYSAPLVSLVPRAVWPAKPTDLLPPVYINKTIFFNSCATSLVGEAFISFGAFGVILVMGVVGFVLNYWSVRGHRSTPGSAWQLFGIVVAAISIQVFRDGVYSITYFLLYNFGAALIIIGVDRASAVARKALCPSVGGITARATPRSTPV
jgi:hypothetical protein